MSWWTAEHVLVIFNAVLAAAATGTAVVGVSSIKSANRVAAAAEKETKAVGEQVAAVRDQADLQRRSLAGSIRPLVADVPADTANIVTSFAANGVIDIRVPLRNVGSGPAFIVGSAMKPQPSLFWVASTSHSVVPPGELVMVSLQREGDKEIASLAQSALNDSQDGLCVVLQYSDLVDGQRTQTTLAIKREEIRPGSGGGFGYVNRVKAVCLYNCDENWSPHPEPFVSSGTPTP